MHNWINRIEQRMMVKYFFLKRHGSKLIHKELVSKFQDSAISLSTLKNWLRRFKSGDLSYSDEKLPGRPLLSLDLTLQRFLKRFSFVNIRVMASHFSMDRSTIKNIIDRKLGLR
jgi:transposase